MAKTRQSQKTRLANLRALRKALGRTQTQVATAVGVPQAMYSKWERGQVMPDGRYLPKLMDALKVKVISELGFSDDSSGQERTLHDTTKEGVLPRQTRVRTSPLRPLKAGDDATETAPIRDLTARLQELEARLVVLEQSVTQTAKTTRAAGRTGKRLSARSQGH